MVAAKCLNPEFVNLDFWRRMPGKFKGIRLYEDRKSKIREVIQLHQLNLININFFFNFQLTGIKTKSADNVPPSTTGNLSALDQDQQQLQPTQQLREQPTKQPTTLVTKKANRKGKGRKKNDANEIDAKKQKKEIGESIEEELDDSGIYSNVGESVYEDFDEY